MARPRKVGLDYFSHDTDTSTDDKIEAIEVKHGPTGYALYFKCLERIYRAGGPIDITGVFRPIMAAKLRITEEALDEIIQFAIDVGLLYRENDNKIMSHGAKKRLEFIGKEREKDRNRVPGSFPVENGSGNPQRKGKEIKGNQKEIDPALARRVIAYLNDKAEKAYRIGKATQTIIQARQADGFTEEEFRKVIDTKVATWKGTDYEQYLRPETLFRASKMDGYLNEVPRARVNDVARGSGFSQRREGFDDGRPDLDFFEPTGTQG